MKSLYKLIFLISLVVFTGCEKQDNTEVENYIDLLKTGQYDSYDLPDFQPSDIPALLKFRNDTTSVMKFPRNPISSYMQMKCKLGMLVLWTIESVRAVEIDSEFLIGRFPSQNPVLATMETPSRWVFDEKSHFTAAKAYYEWWNSIHIFTDKMKTDPLKNTGYRWK